MKWTDDRRADLLSVFDGPSGHINAVARANGLAVMPPVDTRAKHPWDLLDDRVHAKLMTGILAERPAVTIYAPPCRAWCRARNFASGNPKMMAKLEDERVVQRRLMKRMNLLIEANFAYSAHVIIENPLHSKFWRQDFFTDILDKLPSGRRWRKFTVNYCRVGGRHFKGWFHMKPQKFRALGLAEFVRDV